MKARSDEAWPWLMLAAVCALLAAVQFVDMVTENSLIVDALFFLVALALTIYFVTRWSSHDHRPPWR